MILSMDIERYKKIVSAVEVLSETEKEEIFKMIHCHNCSYTKNNNGVFVNLAWINSDLMEQLEKYIEFCNKSDIEIRKYESLCDILNSKLNSQQTEDSSQNPQNVENELVDVDDALRSSKMSSTTKFMMLKKKLAKVYVSAMHDDELTKDNPLIKK